MSYNRLREHGRLLRELWKAEASNDRELTKACIRAVRESEATLTRAEKDAILRGDYTYEGSPDGT